MPESGIQVTCYQSLIPVMIRETLFAFTQMQAGHGIGAGVVTCTKVRTSWLSSVLGLAGGREAWKAWISRIFFCLSYMFSLRQVGEKD